MRKSSREGLEHATQAFGSSDSREPSACGILQTRLSQLHHTDIFVAPLSFPTQCTLPLTERVDEHLLPVPAACRVAQASYRGGTRTMERTSTPRVDQEGGAGSAVDAGHQVEAGDADPDSELRLVRARSFPRSERSAARRSVLTRQVLRALAVWALLLREEDPACLRTSRHHVRQPKRQSVLRRAGHDPDALRTQ